MGSYCLSSASILRCQSFTRLESELLIIPTAIEIIFSTSLIVTNWGTGRRHLLLTAEGWIYFSLSLLELLSHIIPAARDNIMVFKIIDFVLGATSSLPILLYTVFIYLFTRAELIINLPLRLQKLSAFALLIFIPAIIVFNEMASFIGITHRVIQVGSIDVLAIGFKDNSGQLFWAFFTSLTLALLTAYQAVNFSFAFYRVIKALIDQRRIEVSSVDRNHLFKGVGWIAGGLKLGAIESVIGFAQGGFGGALTRRIIRLLARAFICIGLVKGMDDVEDFRELHQEIKAKGRKEFRKSKMHQMISNPRFSTFEKLTPTATAFHSIPRAAPQAIRIPSQAPSVADVSPIWPSGTDDFLSMKDESVSERVTVHIDEGKAPTLHLRFSAFDLPSPGTIVEGMKIRSQYDWASSRRLSTYSAALSMNQTNPPLPAQPWTPIPAPPRTKNSFMSSQRVLSSFSEKSVPDTLYAVRELAAQFPPLPAGAITQNTQHIDGVQPGPSQDHLHSGRLRSLRAERRKTMLSSSSIAPISERGVVPSFSTLPNNPFDDPSATSDVDGETLGSPKRALYSQWSVSEASSPLATTTPIIPKPGFEDNNVSRITPWVGSSSAKPSPTSDIHSNTEVEEYRRGRSLSQERYEPSSEWDNSSTFRDEQNDRGKIDDTLTIPWLKDSEMMEEDDARVARVLGKKASMVRIKTVGKAPRKYTPAPIETGHARGSFSIVPVMTPRQGAATMMIAQGSSTTTSSGAVLRDSEVLGIEGGNARSFFNHD